MCWITKCKERAEACVAETDIPVFKVVDWSRGMKRPYYFSREGMYAVDEGGRRTVVREYEAGRTFEPLAPVTVEQLDEATYVAGRGIHSYSETDCVTYRSHSGNVCVAWCSPRSEKVPEKSLDMFPRADVPLRMRCVIPAGTRYFLNEYGEYVSDRIRVEGFRLLASCRDF